MYDLGDEIYSIATPLVKSALALFRLSGKNIFQKIDKIFNNTRFLSGKGRKIYYGKIHYNSNIIDEVLISKFISPKSYTGEDLLEISCHGSLLIIRELSLLFEKLNIRQSKPGEFSFRAFLNGKIDLSKAEAIHNLIESSNILEREVSTNNLNGELFKKINNLKKELLRLVAFLTVQIDYDENELEDILIKEENFISLIKELEILLKNYLIKKSYKKGINLAIIGLANSGKSSLFNAFLKEDRSIVSDTLGTTRDYIKEVIEYKKMHINLFDTAGFRENITLDKIEDQGIKKSLSLLNEADYIIYLVDSSTGLQEKDKIYLDLIKNKKYILVYSKADLTSDQSSFSKEDILISVKQNYGIEKILERLEKDYPNLDIKNSIILSNDRQEKLISECKDSLQKALEYIKLDSNLEFILSEAQQALQCLGKITGEVYSQDILDEVFSNFCVGK